jgi:hypothetical protein
VLRRICGYDAEAIARAESENAFGDAAPADGRPTDVYPSAVT